MSAYYNSLLRIQMYRFYQSSLGFVDEELLLALGGKGVAFRRPIFAELWPDLKVQFEPEFQEFIETETLPLVQDSCPGVL